MPDGGREVADNHPLRRVITQTPNGWQTPFEFREQLQISLGMRGNAFSLIERSGNGKVTGLIPVKASDVTVLKGNDRLPYYQFLDPLSGRPTEPVPQRMVHHVRWGSVNGYVGLSPILLHANQIGYGMAVQEYAGKSFVNGPGLAGVLERPRDATAIKDQAAIDKLQSDWIAKFGGSDNAGKVALLQEGMTFRPLTMNNVDADLINALSLSVTDAARIYRVPPHMIGELTKTTSWGTGIESQSIGFVIYTLLPWIKRHEQAMMRDLLDSKERESLYVEFNVAGLMRGDQQSRYTAYALGRQWGWLSKNDVRRLENLPPIPEGDDYLTPLNMTPGNVPADQPSAKAQHEIEDILQ